MLYSTDNLRVAAGRDLPRAIALPVAAGAGELRSNALDRLGSLVRGIAGALTARDAARAVQPASQLPLGKDNGSSTSHQGPERVRVLTLNIRGGLGPPGAGASAAHLDAVVDSVRRHDPDVVLLQEVDDFAARSGFRDQVDLLAALLGPDAAVAAAPVQRATGRRQHVAVLTFNGFAVDDARNLVAPSAHGDGALRRLAAVTAAALRALRLPVPQSDAWRSHSPRNTLDTMVMTPGGRSLRVLSTHLSGGIGGARPADELQPLAGVLAAWHGPTLLGGDFNVLSKSPHGRAEATALAKAGLVDAFTAAGIGPGDPRRRSFLSEKSAGDIDRIYASRHLTLRSATVDRASPASDHLPVVAEYDLR